MMKWWGWGAADRSFDLMARPLLRPWLESNFDFDLDESTPPSDRDDIRLDVPLDTDDFIATLGDALRPDQFATDDDERLLHAFGKSYPDLFRVRRGEVPRAPDLVVLPENHDQVATLVAAAARSGVVVIPFGGGTNIVGGVNPLADERRPVVSLDLRRMDGLLRLDEESCSATMQAGMLGPKIEADLNAKGWSLGHYPDSFEYSSLGGWLATRSAGMQSDAYGKIEDMVVSVKVATPAGTIDTLAVPRSASGPSLNQILVGSEGTLGVITEATMRVHRAPERKEFHGVLFRSFAEGVAAIRECVHSGCGPTLFRISDEGETQFSMHLKPKPKGLERFINRLVKKWLIRRGYERPCLMMAGFEGSAQRVAEMKRRCVPVLKSHGAFMLGTGVGERWSSDKFNLPYIRDAVMDFGVRVDVAETATSWSKLLPLYEETIATIRNRYEADGKRGYAGCHLSHSYETGACLYFTWAVRQEDDPKKELEGYYGYKRAITDLFVASGATLSHHHAVGTEHRDWMEREIGPTGVRALVGLKASLDPDSIMNPGKLIPEVPGAGHD